MKTDKNTTLMGFWFTVASFLIWGVLPIYWKELIHFNAFIILGHRIVWSMLFTLVLLVLLKRFSELKNAYNTPKNFILVLCRALCLGGNWLVYVWAISINQILQCSLGYFITPLTVVFLGYIFLNEKPTKRQTFSLLLVFISVLNLIFNYGHFPWISIAIALTFGFYSLLRKTSVMESLPGLNSEVAVLFLPALLYLIFSDYHSSWSTYNDISLKMVVMLMGTGIVTAIPLLFFAFGIRKIHISTAGILQYITPTSTFFIGAFMYNEPFTKSQLISFVIIWVGIAIYISDLKRKKVR